MGSLGENGYMYVYGWVPSLFTWTYHNIVNWLYPNTKMFLALLKKKKGNEVGLPRAHGWVKERWGLEWYWSSVRTQEERNRCWLATTSATVYPVGNSAHRFPLRRARKYPWVFLKLLPVAQLSQVKQLIIVGWKSPQGRESSEGWIRFRANGYSRQRKLDKKMSRTQGWKYRIGLWGPWTPSGGLWASLRQWGLQRTLE